MVPKGCQQGTSHLEIPISTRRKPHAPMAVQHPPVCFSRVKDIVLVDCILSTRLLTMISCPESSLLRWATSALERSGGNLSAAKLAQHGDDAKSGISVRSCSCQKILLSKKSNARLFKTEVQKCSGSELKKGPTRELRNVSRRSTCPPRPEQPKAEPAGDLARTNRKVSSHDYNPLSGLTMASGFLPWLTPLAVAWQSYLARQTNSREVPTPRFLKLQRPQV